MAQYRTIAGFTAGNARGIVEEPVTKRTIPRKERGEKWRVKIGVIDETQPCSKAEFQAVVDQLTAFLEQHTDCRR